MFVTPGSTHTRWFSRSISRIRFIRESTIRTPSSTGSAPPERPEPAPRATHGTPTRAHAATTRCTSSAVPGSAAAAGTARYCSSPSDSYVRSWCSCVYTHLSPQIVRSSRGERAQVPLGGVRLRRAWGDGGAFGGCG